MVWVRVRVTFAVVTFAVVIFAVLTSAVVTFAVLTFAVVTFAVESAVVTFAVVYVCQKVDVKKRPFTPYISYRKSGVWVKSRETSPVNIRIVRSSISLFSPSWSTFSGIAILYLPTFYLPKFQTI